MTALEKLVQQTRAELAAGTGPHGVKDAPNVKDAPRVKDAPTIRRAVC